MNNLTSKKVEYLFLSCLYTKEEAVGKTREQLENEGAKGDGVSMCVLFNPERLTAAKPLIQEMLSELTLSDTEKGKGVSFLALCTQKDGTQWTGTQQIMDNLVCLGSAAGLLTLFPSVQNRKLWTALPGGMPYVMLRANA